MNVPNTPARGPEEARAVPPGGPPITWGSEGGLWGSIGEHLPGGERPTVTSSEPVAGQRSDAEMPARPVFTPGEGPGAWSTGIPGGAEDTQPGVGTVHAGGSGAWNAAEIQRRKAEFLWNTQRTFLDLIDGVTDPKQLMDMVMPGSPDDAVTRALELVRMGMGDVFPDEATRAVKGIRAGMDALLPDEATRAVKGIRAGVNALLPDEATRAVTLTDLSDWSTSPYSPYQYCAPPEYHNIDMYRGGVHGFIGAVNQTIQSVYDLGEELREWLPEWMDYSLNVDFRPDKDGRVPGISLDKGAPIGVPQFLNIDPPTTEAGRFAEGLTRFLTGVVGSGPLLKGLKFGFTGGAAVKLALRDFTAAFTCFDAHEANLSNVIEQMPGASNFLTRMLKINPDDSALAARVKRGLETALLSGAFSGLGAAGQKAASGLAEGFTKAVQILGRVQQTKAGLIEQLGEKTAREFGLLARPAAAGEIGPKSGLAAMAEEAAGTVKAGTRTAAEEGLASSGASAGRAARKPDPFALTPESMSDAIAKSPYKDKAGQVIAVDPAEVRFSQTTISYKRTRPGPGKSKITYTLDDTREGLYKNGWPLDEPIDAVIMPPDGGLTSVDNSRLTLAGELGVDKSGRPIRPLVRVRRPDEPLTAGDKKRFWDVERGFCPQTWGDVARGRIRRQSRVPAGEEYGLGQPPRVSRKE